MSHSCSVGIGALAICCLRASLLGGIHCLASRQNILYFASFTELDLVFYTLQTIELFALANQVITYEEARPQAAH